MAGKYFVYGGVFITGSSINVDMRNRAFLIGYFTFYQLSDMIMGCRRLAQIMKKTILALILVLSMIFVSACSADGNGGGSSTDGFSDSGITNDSSQRCDDHIEDPSGKNEDSSGGGLPDSSGDSSKDGSDDGSTDIPDDSGKSENREEKPISSTDKEAVFQKFENVMDVFSAKESHKLQTKGKTVASTMNYTQNIESVEIKSGGVSSVDYKSTSTLVNLYHTVYVKRNDVIYKENNKQGSINNVTDYRKKYGVAPCDGVLGGYDITLKSLLSGSYSKDDNGKLTMKLTVDGELVSAAMKVQMKQFGGLEALPVFSKLTFTIICNDGENLSSYSVYAEYAIKKKVMFIPTDMTCKMNMTVTVYDYDGKLEFPTSL